MVCCKRYNKRNIFGRRNRYPKLNTGYGSGYKYYYYCEELDRFDNVGGGGAGGGSNCYPCISNRAGASYAYDPYDSVVYSRGINIVNNYSGCCGR